MFPVPSLDVYHTKCIAQSLILTQYIKNQLLVAKPHPVLLDNKNKTTTIT